MFNSNRLDIFSLTAAEDRLTKCKSDRELCQRQQYELRELTDYMERLTIFFKSLRESRGYDHAET